MESFNIMYDDNIDIDIDVDVDVHATIAESDRFSTSIESRCV